MNIGSGHSRIDGPGSECRLPGNCSCGTDRSRALTPDQLAEQIPLMKDRCLFLDFDETLWLKNSTEEFLAIARPRLAVRLLLKLVRLSRPLWRLPDATDTAHLNDWLRVGIIILCMPWTLRAWERQAGELGRAFRNRDLIKLVESAEPAKVIIISNGFRRIVVPLLDAVGLKHDLLVAAPLRSGGRWRMRGKLRNVAGCLPAHQIDQACFITDHPDDAPLLSHVAHGLLCKWPLPEGRTRLAQRP